MFMTKVDLINNLDLCVFEAPLDEIDYVTIVSILLDYIDDPEITNIIKGFEEKIELA
jgi:hypothetical protein